MTTLFQHLMGPDFERLAPEVQRLHSSVGTCRFEGHYTVRGGSGWSVRQISRLLRVPTSPKAMVERSLLFDLVATPHGERWVRKFAHATVRSTLVANNGLLQEQVHMLTLSYVLNEENGALRKTLNGARIFGIPVPSFLLPKVWSLESGVDGQLRFDVGSSLKGFGVLATYAGWLAIVRPPSDDTLLS